MRDDERRNKIARAFEYTMKTKLLIPFLMAALLRVVKPTSKNSTATIIAVTPELHILFFVCVFLMNGNAYKHSIGWLG